MTALDVSLNTIEDFLAQKRIAMVGISRKEHGNFSVMLFKEFVRRGYEIVPVNPNAQEILGSRCFARVQDILPPVDSVLLMTSPEVAEDVVHDCAEAGVRRVWIYGTGETDSIRSKAVEFCRERGIQVIPGQCPFMFLPKNGFHRIHGWIQKMRGIYPQRIESSSPAQ